MTKIITSYDCPPIPYRGADWSAHFDWDEGGASMTGRGETEESAVIDLLRLAIEDDGDGAPQDEVINLAMAGWRNESAN